MMKRPLGTLCLLITGAIFLVTEFSGGKTTEDIRFPEEELCIVGTVYKKDLAKAERSAAVYLKDVMFENTSIPENCAVEHVICYLHTASKEAKIGSRIKVRGYPSEFQEATNPGQFDMKFYYQLSGISFRLSGAYILTESTAYNKFGEGLYRLRCLLAAQLDAGLPKEEAGVMKTMLLGAKGSMEEEWKALYQRNGIAHILAISGLHISLLGMGTFKLIRRLGVPIGAAAAVSGGLMFCYGIMTGFSVSMLRAVIMFLLHMLAKMMGRTYDMLTAAGVAAVLILLEQPLYLYYGGFIFSFGCVLGIGLLMPALTESKNPLPAWWKCILSGCAMAAISYPMYLWFYYQFPPYSVLLNLFVVPLMSFLMAAGMILLAMQSFCPGAAFLPALLIQGILRIYETACNICDRLPGHMFTLGKPETWQLCLYLMILALIVSTKAFKKKKVSLKVKWLMALAGIMLLTIRPWNALELTFLDMGQGDCIFVKSRIGNHYLIDGGSTSLPAVGKYRIIPFLKYKGAGELEAVIVTHPDEDHISGILELLEQGQFEGISIKNLVLPEIKEELKNAAYKELELAAQSAGTAVSYINTGEGIVDGKMLMQCLNPRTDEIYQEANEYSVVVELAEQDISVLLTGDAEGVGERVLLEEFIQREGNVPITVLKAAHHGSRYSTSEELLEILKPRVVIISCGKNNPYGHPHKETLDRLKEVGSKVLITAEHGAVTVKADREVEVYSFRQSQ